MSIWSRIAFDKGRSRRTQTSGLLLFFHLYISAVLELAYCLPIFLISYLSLIISPFPQPIKSLNILLPHLHFITFICMHILKKHYFFNLLSVHCKMYLATTQQLGQWPSLPYFITCTSESHVKDDFPVLCNVTFFSRIPASFFHPSGCWLNIFNLIKNMVIWLI